MKNPKHMHSVGDFWVYYGIDYRSNCTGKLEYCWLASPKASGTYRRAAVCISGLNGRPGSVAKRIGPRRWKVTVPPYNPVYSSRWPDEFVVFATTRRKALILADIYQQYGRPGSPQLITLGSSIVATIKILGSRVKGTSDRWVIVLPTRRVPAPPKRRTV